MYLCKFQHLAYLSEVSTRPLRLWRNWLSICEAIRVRLNITIICISSGLLLLIVRSGHDARWPRLLRLVLRLLLLASRGGRAVERGSRCGRVLIRGELWPWRVKVISSIMRRCSRHVDRGRVRLIGGREESGLWRLLALVRGICVLLLLLHGHLGSGLVVLSRHDLGWRGSLGVGRIGRGSEGGHLGGPSSMSWVKVRCDRLVGVVRPLLAVALRGTSPIGMGERIVVDSDRRRHGTRAEYEELVQKMVFDI